MFHQLMTTNQELRKENVASEKDPAAQSIGPYFACLLSLRLSISEPDAAHEVLKAWFGTKGIKNRIHVEVDHQIVVLT